MNVLDRLIHGILANQEDSLIMNQASIDRGLFNGSKFTYELSIKEDNKEVFGIPDITKTLDTKATSYDRLTPQGYVPVGTVVNKGDIIISKYAPLPEGFDKQYQFQDMSMKWGYEESAVVTCVVIGAFEDGKKFTKIGFRKLRHVQLGDKFSARSGQKGVIGMTLQQSQMPFTENGITPSIIMNPHAIPSRINRLSQCSINKYLTN